MTGSVSYRTLKFRVVFTETFKQWVEKRTFKTREVLGDYDDQYLM